MVTLSVVLGIVAVFVGVVYLDLRRERIWREQNRVQRDRDYADILIESGDNPWLHVKR